MAAGTKSIQVMDMRSEGYETGGRDFRVKRSTNIITHLMDDFLTESQVESLIKSGVKVSVIPYA